MAALWSYPWTLSEEGLEAAWSTLSDVGVDAINLASHYHSVRSMQPRFPDRLFESYPGGCYFDPAADDRFDGTLIDPLPNAVPPFDDPLAEIVESADAADIDVNGWVVLFHNSRLGATYPEYRAESAFGDPQDHAFCPSHPEVREYFAAVVGAVADRGVAEIQLEKAGYPTVFHGHGWEFGHDKRQVLTSRTEELLLSQCFCDGCRAAAQSRGVDLDGARRTVRELLETSFDRPHLDAPGLDALVTEYPAVQELIDFRASVVADLFERLSAAAGTTPLNYYVMDGGGLNGDDVWPAGIRLSGLVDHVDRVTALCYVRSPDAARDRIDGIDRLFEGPVDAGITLDHEINRNEAELQRLIKAVGRATDGQIHVYHYSLATDVQLAWLRSVL
ncbi:hypothetical protein [Natrinema gelatinilyticum]|uniref:hypothetical protein n=1 Tax=Natrinema gelatinilyticum TaxID=2961571 RepID=UPI0020C41D08|nr:hypothetical protein [Natrinema gelatinilyticum]